MFLWRFQRITQGFFFFFFFWFFFFSSFLIRKPFDKEVLTYSNSRRLILFMIVYLYTVFNENKF